jgi:hypothetical protein
MTRTSIPGLSPSFSRDKVCPQLTESSVSPPEPLRRLLPVSVPAFRVNCKGVALSVGRVAATPRRRRSCALRIRTICEKARRSSRVRVWEKGVRERGSPGEKRSKRNGKIAARPRRSAHRSQSGRFGVGGRSGLAIVCCRSLCNCAGFNRKNCTLLVYPGELIKPTLTVSAPDSEIHSRCRRCDPRVTGLPSPPPSSSSLLSAEP